MDCPLIPSSKAKEAISRTNDTGNEHGFVFCPDGSSGPMLSGGEREMEIEGSCGASRMAIFHTHPNGTLRLSKQDRQVLARDDVSMVCVGVDGGEVVCERTKPTCTTQL